MIKYLAILEVTIDIAIAISLGYIAISMAIMAFNIVLVINVLLISAIISITSYKKHPEWFE